MPRLLVATRNPHKTAEIRAILGPAWEIEDLTAHPEIVPPDENGATFAENATLKAVSASHLFDELVLADDSGLEVDALGGAPGVFSARYAGSNATDSENRAKLLEQLASVAPERRTARFQCAIALAHRSRLLGIFNGVVEGVIIDRERGEGGFGYDSLFVPDGFAETAAELPAATKNTISHRARALTSALRVAERFGSTRR